MSNRVTERLTKSERSLAELRGTVAGESSGIADMNSASPTHEEIAERAYQIFLERGAEDGHDLEDWYRAEAELTSKACAATV